MNQLALNCVRHIFYYTISTISAVCCPRPRTAHSTYSILHILFKLRLNWFWWLACFVRSSKQKTEPNICLLLSKSAFFCTFAICENKMKMVGLLGYVLSASAMICWSAKAAKVVQSQISPDNYAIYQQLKGNDKYSITRSIFCCSILYPINSSHFQFHAA